MQNYIHYENKHQQKWIVFHSIFTCAHCVIWLNEVGYGYCFLLLMLLEVWLINKVYKEEV